MKKNDLSNLLKTASVLFVLLFTLTACDQQSKSEEKNQPQKAQISIQYHTPETLKKYRFDVKKYHEQQKHNTSDTINNVQKITKELEQNGR